MRILSVFTAILLLLTFIVSCGSGGGSSSETTIDTAGGESESEAVETEVSDDLGEMDFEGVDFRIVTGQHQGYPTATFSYEEQTGDVLEDALYARNVKLEERFNVNFTENNLSDIFTVNSVVKEFTYAGDDAYEMAMMIDRFALKAGIDGQLHSYNELSNINLEKPYWNQRVSDDFTIGGKLFFTYGDDNLVFFQSTTMLAFNKKLHENYGLDNIYDLVRSGTWTTEKYFAMCEAVSSDLDGNGKYNIEDQYGQVIVTNMYYANFWLQDDLRLVEKDSEDMPYFNVTGNEKLISLMEDIRTRAYTGNISYNLDLEKDWSSQFGSEGTYNSAMQVFMAGKSLFVSASLTSIPVARSMETDFGIIPYPKTEETFAGDAYGSRTFGGFPYVVPITVSDTDMVSAIMEALACESSKTVIPVLYDQVLKAKSSRDTDSEEMLDLMRSKRLTDLGETYWWDDVESIYEAAFRSQNKSFSSLTAANEEKINIVIGEYIDFFNSMK